MILCEGIAPWHPWKDGPKPAKWHGFGRDAFVKLSCSFDRFDQNHRFFKGLASDGFRRCHHLRKLVGLLRNGIILLWASYGDFSRTSDWQVLSRKRNVGKMFFGSALSELDCWGSWGWDRFCVGLLCGGLNRKGSSAV